MGGGTLLGNCVDATALVSLGQAPVAAAGGDSCSVVAVGPPPPLELPPHATRVTTSGLSNAVAMRRSRKSAAMSFLSPGTSGQEMRQVALADDLDVRRG